MKAIYIKHIFIAALLCLIVLPASGQTPNTEFFMKSSHQKLTFNPALRPRQGQVSFPFLGNISAGVRTNTLNLDHLVFERGDDLVLFTSPSVSSESFLSNMAKNNHADVDFNMSIFSMGKYVGNNGYLFFDLNTRIDASANIPYSFFEFIKKGIAENEASQYNLKDVHAQAKGYVEIGAGYSHSLLDNSLVIGGKGKLLLGAFYGDARINEMKVDAGADLWTINSDITLQAALLGGLTPEYDNDDRFDGISTDIKAEIPGWGLGLDVGASFNLGGLENFIPDMGATDLLNRFTFSLAFTDIGFINWNKKSSLYMASKLEDTVITGNYQIDLDDSNSLSDQIEEVGDKLKDITDLKEYDPKSKSTSLSTNMNIGLEYDVLPEKLSVGVLSSTRFNPVHTISELTLGGSYRPISWFEAALSYSCVFNQFNTFGLALHIAPKNGINIFLSSDYLIPHLSGDFLPISAEGANFMMGISFPLGRRASN